MIDYVEIRNENTEVVGIIDVAKSIIWRSSYFGVGDFEIYAPAHGDALGLLRIGYYVTRPDNSEVGIIESIEIANDIRDGLMIAAKGRFAKSILDRRLIYNLSGATNTATILRGNVEAAVRGVVSSNAIACAFDTRRNIPRLELGTLAAIPKIIVDSDGKATEKQVSFGNLLEYTDSLLEEYGMAATVKLNAGKLQYAVYQGADRSTGNTAGNTPIVFSQEYDNLTGSDYLYNAATEKNVALIGGEGEGIERFYSLLAGAKTGLSRREMWVDAQSISKTYKDASNTEQTYTDAEYKAMLDAEGKQLLAPLVATEAFSGTIDITNGNWVYGRDFALGDLVTVQDNGIGIYATARVSEITEVQDENGYTVAATIEKGV